MRVLLPLLAAALLSACASHGGSSYAGRSFPFGGAIPLECGPYARALSGVQLSGDAASWWDQAAGRYVRASRPSVGSVLVFAETGRLPHGHVAVVSGVTSSRQIMVTQANWVHRVVTEDQPVVDVSSANDWSLVRVWWPPSDTMGATDYPTLGFVRPEHPASHSQLLASSVHAAEVATGH